jgi:uncharacterized membrane protein (DUF485 family)
MESVKPSNAPKSSPAARAAQPHDHRTVLASPEFQAMVRRRWMVSLTLTVALCIMYYGYVLLIAMNKPLLATRVGEVVTLGIPLGVAVIAGAWVLTGIYVVWANQQHDVAVRALRARLDP